MARSCVDERWGNPNAEEQEEEEEALSLCDLPVNLISEEKQSRNEEAKSCKTEEDFDFGSWGGSLLTAESEMCAADEVFFQGQILPLRLSVSSDSGLYPGSRHDSRNASRCNSRSESMDHRCSSGFSGISSRSSSIRSHHSSSSSSTATPTTTKYKPRVRNQFHTHPSPKPQIRVSGLRHGHVSSCNRKSTMWEFFRLGLVRTPEIELQDLRLRTSNATSNKNFGSRNSNSSSNSSGSFRHRKNIRGSNDAEKSNYDANTKKNKKQRFFTKENTFLSSCKCSAGAVETVSSRFVIMKSVACSGTGGGNDESETHAIKEKLQQMKMQKRQQQGKQAMSRHRTFEWLKELSLEGDLDQA
ncbi:hypothetical protein L1049_010789 [Liquidambar formosana]|uniref:Uncharacterized protein n=1 Tax=Liquidambar formosana TaxID=63359 RepID=A0AAP0R1K9_LIQFO